MKSNKILKVLVLGATLMCVASTPVIANAEVKNGLEVSDDVIFIDGNGNFEINGQTYNTDQLNDADVISEAFGIPEIGSNASETTDGTTDSDESDTSDTNNAESIEATNNETVSNKEVDAESQSEETQVEETESEVETETESETETEEPTYNKVDRSSFENNNMVFIIMLVLVVVTTAVVVALLIFVKKNGKNEKAETEVVKEELTENELPEKDESSEK